jgi:hypothetical protein
VVISGKSTGNNLPVSANAYAQQCGGSAALLHAGPTQINAISAIRGRHRLPGSRLRLEATVNFRGKPQTLSAGN